MKVIKIKNKSKKVEKLIRSMLEVLDAIGIPLEMAKSDQTRMRIAEATLAVAGIKTSFSEAKSSDDNHFLTTRQIINYENDYLDGEYSPGAYDDIRRAHLIMQTVSGCIISSSQFKEQSTNTPTRGYACSPLFAELLRSYGTKKWDVLALKFQKENESLREKLAHKRELERIPIKFPNGKEITLSAGPHNKLQGAIINDFLPRFGFGAEILYLGDTTDKYLIREEKKLKELHFFELEHEELPDVIAYSHEKNLLFLIEAVHSYGQMGEIRVMKIKEKLKECTAEVVIVSAFEDKKKFRKFSDDIAWESEVWIAEDPDHMVHFNGIKFLDIHKNV